MPRTAGTLANKRDSPTTRDSAPRPSPNRGDPSRRWQPDQGPPAQPALGPAAPGATPPAAPRARAGAQQVSHHGTGAVARVVHSQHGAAEVGSDQGPVQGYRQRPLGAPAPAQRLHHLQRRPVPGGPRVSAACTACSISSCPSLERRSSAASSMEALSECPQVTPASTAPQVTRAGLPLGPAWPQALSALPPAVGRRGRSSVGSLDRRHRPPDQGMGPRRPPPPGPRAGGGGLRPSPSFEAARVGLSRVRVLHCNTLGWQEWPPGARPAAHGVSRGPHRGGSGSRQSCPHRQRGARTLWAPPWTGH